MLLYLSKLSPSQTTAAVCSPCTGADERFVTGKSGCRANAPFEATKGNCHRIRMLQRWFNVKLFELKLKNLLCSTRVWIPDLSSNSGLCNICCLFYLKSFFCCVPVFSSFHTRSQHTSKLTKPKHYLFANTCPWICESWLRWKQRSNICASDVLMQSTSCKQK